METNFEGLEERIKQIGGSIQGLHQELEEKKGELARLKELTEVKSRIRDVSDEDLLEFAKKPYVILPKGAHSALVVVPKFVKNFQPGWLERETETYFIYEINQYSRWLGDVPQDLLDQIKVPEMEGIHIEGGRMFFPPTEKEKLKRIFGQHLKDFDENNAVLIRGHEFDLIADLVENGCLPFTPKPVAKEDLREKRVKFQLYDYQQEAFEKFLKTGAAGLFFPTGAGKSFVALAAMDAVKGKKLVIVPTLTLAEQWNYYIETHAPHLKGEVRIATYYMRPTDEEFALVVFDECQRLPADSFSRLALVKTKYRLGLSASPHREDDRESYIFALTGYPIGLNWQEYMKRTGKKYHEVNIWVLKGQHHKMQAIERLYNPKEKTLIFCDGIEFGKKIAQQFNVPFIFGQTTDRLEAVAQNNPIVASRVLDLGISIKNLQHIIEADFHHGSRQQELQRTGRLMHSEELEVGRHDILMTNEEFHSYGKRLFALQEKGFHVEVHESLTEMEK